jgi:hypothetical protein
MTPEFSDREILILQRMLGHESIDYPILALRGVPRNTTDAWETILLMRSLYAKGAIDHPESPRLCIRLTDRIARMAGVVAERPTMDDPVRWMPRSKAIKIRIEREGRSVKTRTINECDRNKFHRGKNALENFPDYRRDYDSPIVPDSRLTIIGVSSTWNRSSNEECEVCHGKPKRNEYCLRCDLLGGAKNRKQS